MNHFWGNALDFDGDTPQLASEAETLAPAGFAADFPNQLFSYITEMLSNTAKSKRIILRDAVVDEPRDLVNRCLMLAMIPADHIWPVRMVRAV